MKLTLSRFILSSWLWALFPTLVISFFINGIGKRYSIIIENRANGKEVQQIFADLNGDGITEQIHGKPGFPLNNFPVMDSEGKYFDQWNLADEMLPDISRIYVGNYDHDLFSELYIFTARHDSIFLNVNEFFEPTGLHLERVFITTVNLVEDHNSCNLRHIGFFDQNNDGKDEFYFRITSGFGLWPRLCYFYDLANQKLKSGPFTGINFNGVTMADIDGDLRPEIFSNMTASGNYETQTPFTDYSTWLMVLDDQFQFKFNPIEFPGFGGSLDIYEMNKNLLVVYNFQGAEKQVHSPGIMFYSPQGQLRKHVSFSDLRLNGQVQSMVVNSGKQRRILLLGGSMFVLLNDQMEELHRKETSIHPGLFTYQYDVTNDGQNEIFLYTDDKRLTIYDLDLKEYGSFPFDVAAYEWRVSRMISKAGESKLFIQAGDKCYFLRLSENSFYWLAYLTYPSIYLGFVLFIGLIKRVNSAQVEKRESQKRKLQTLQLQAIKGQLDPHFTFNALNSVAALLYLDDRKAAYDHLNKFTRLLRQMLNDAERIYRPVEEELEFVNVYLELEKLRFGDKFQFDIEVGENVSLKEQIPVLSIQTFVENAIKHGLIPKGAGGKLKISIQHEGDDLKLTIDDNGIGRAKASALSNSTGKGLKLNSEFYNILNQGSTRPIRHTITDLFDETGNPAGTKVEVWVPL